MQELRFGIACAAREPIIMVNGIIARVTRQLAGVGFAALICVHLAQAQSEVKSDNQADPESSESKHAPGPVNSRPAAPPKRIFGLVPNYRTTPESKDYRPISPRQKFGLATQDSFDRGTLVLTALFAGQGQLTNSNPSFGQGAAGYARYFAASYTDFVVGNYMTEAIYPTILHEDPRYFRRGSGSAWSRLGSAMRQIVWTRADSGRMQFNFPEILGNSTGVAISNVYYRDNRTASDAVTKFGIQIGVDMASNVLKEFSPELSSIFSRKRKASTH
jgi:hypothetical protein